MKKRKIWVFILIPGLLLLIWAIAYSYIYQERNHDNSKKVSVIVHGENTQRWENFHQGVLQAAADLNADVTFLTMTDDTSIENQTGLVKRQVKNNVQGMIISAVDSEGMSDIVQETARHIPVVMSENNIYSDNDTPLEYISADNQKMGEALAEKIMEENDRTTPIYILKANQQRDCVLKRQGALASKLQSNGYTVAYWEPGDEEADFTLFISKMVEKHERGVIAAIDEIALENVIDGTQEYWDQDKGKDMLRPVIYGIGSTAKIVYSLERNLIKGIVFQDEYHMGYTSMVRLCRQLKDGEASLTGGSEIEFYSANKDTMHLPEKERLLYPIIQ